MRGRFPLIGATARRAIDSTGLEGDDLTLIALIGGGARLPGVDHPVRTVLNTIGGGEFLPGMAFEPAAPGPTIIADRPVHAIAYGARAELATQQATYGRRPSSR